jgi:hypothetical protein
LGLVVFTLLWNVTATEKPFDAHEAWQTHSHEAYMQPVNVWWWHENTAKHQRAVAAM